jgi:hypothetical protein
MSTTLPTARIAARRISFIPLPGYAKASISLDTSGSAPKTIVEFLAFCLGQYENNYRGNLMIIEYDPQDLLTEDQDEEQSVPVNMEALAKQANRMFMEQVCGPNSSGRQNCDSIPQVKVKNQFTSKGGQVFGQKPVFTIQTEYRYEPPFNEKTKKKYQDGTYFMPPHYKI